MSNNANDFSSDTNGKNVAQGDPQPLDMDALIYAEISKNLRVTRAAIAELAGVSEKTIERRLKELPNTVYVGRGSNVHWEIK